MDSQGARKPKSAKLQFDDLAAYRRARGENQSEFWRRFGVTQSGGSRYESGRSVPKPVRLLMTMYADGKISDDDLVAAAGGKAKRKKS
ncbi:MAG TPA: helix-turn-helix transcriptional regulator [Rhodocyclaceae bacterium]|nr:helix-turn-helix transcriptional regulator [Rhodocyclaceae bacterium]HMZ84864.1 helix-turn-helix transcriptional regulator [Rhodocyclaceae bacterium]HNA04417.1 helix-turn-helix transcriptional regulator [Rhodocyclaceae bacterium]HNB79095.1 helix-turn-helix transcriptional regulator [Rhodocyclaceae bacterium]HNC62288.1 helix-turn-helix transcriptional regulator [Rhodocyclaceae bacterium]